MSAVASARPPSLTANLAWNVIGESMPVLAAVVAIRALMHQLGADRFGVLMLLWAVAGYFGLFDFGLGRALTRAMAQELSLARVANAVKMFCAVLAMTLAAGAFAGAMLAMLAARLICSALRIPAALQDETIAGLRLIALAMPLLVSVSALRAALSAADRFDLLNLIRTPAGVMSFVAPALVLPFTHNLTWLIAALVANRAISWLAYAGAVICAVPDLRSNPRLDLRCVFPLLGFGAWVTVSGVVVPMLLYVDRFFIGARLALATFAAYSIPMEIIGKTVVLPAAIAGVMFPAFTRSLAASPATLRPLFLRSLALLALILLPLCTGVAAFALQLMSYLMGHQYDVEPAARVLQILAVGSFVAGLAWIPHTLLHGAHRPDLPTKVHLIDFPIYVAMLWVFVGRFGIVGVATIWSIRIGAESLILFSMASRYVPFTRSELAIGGALLMVAVAAMVSGTMMTGFVVRSGSLCALSILSILCGWRFVLDLNHRSRILGRLSAIMRPELAKAANWP